MSGLNGLLLVGPTGAGKSPLGELIEARGLWGRRCAHFDFGGNLRHVAAGEYRPSGLSDADVRAIATSLRTGALLENEQFPIAARILTGFAADRRIAGGDLLILNGLPRHVGQARDVEAHVTVRAVISLECSADVVRQRIATNSGGDRTGRVDDDRAAIVRKLDLFNQRTRPLLDHYRRQGRPILAFTVTASTTAGEVYRSLAAADLALP